MKVAIPEWQGRVSPVFDVATNVLVTELTEGQQVGRQKITLTATDPIERARQVAAIPADVLICGAVSWPLELALRAAGITLITEICGPIEQVMQSFLSNNLANEAFQMPGCCGRRRFRQGRGNGYPPQDGQDGNKDIPNQRRRQRRRICQNRQKTRKT